MNTNTSSTYCGSCTNSCTGGRTCSSGSCTCASGTSDCGLGGTCYNTASDPSHCGSTCKQCGASQVCTSGQCACPLGGVQASCGTCLSWDFEAGTSLADTNGWVRNAGLSLHRFVHIYRVTSPTYNGSGHSLAISVQNGTGFGVTVPLCPAGGSTNLSNLSFSAQALLEGLAGEATVQVLSLMFFAPKNFWSGAGWESPGRSVGTNQWFPVSGSASVPWPTTSPEPRVLLRDGQHLVWHGVSRRRRVLAVNCAGIGSEVRTRDRRRDGRGWSHKRLPAYACRQHRPQA